MITTFYIGQGTVLPYYPIEVRDKDGVVDLSVVGVTAAYFRLANISTASVIVSALATITNATKGQAEYRWAIADTATTGDYAASFLFVTPSGTFALPRNEVAKVVVEPAIVT